ncbi:MAG: hypothetical protein KAF64_11550 [Hydrogenophaga sp.]|nr:hypothetical protein [Hydrogenophaga sp.]
MVKTTLPARRKRVPNGAISERPIALRLLPDELERAKEKADREQRSMASVCRLAVLRDLGLMKKDKP